MPERADRAKRRPRVSRQMLNEKTFQNVPHLEP